MSQAEAELERRAAEENLESLVSGGYVEKGTAAYGIALKVIHEGYGSLSPKQKWVWDNIIEEAQKEFEFDRDLAHAMDSDRS